MISAAPIITLRRFFAVLVLFSSIRFIGKGWIETQILSPVWLFPFDGFEWIPRPNAQGAMGLFVGMIAGGCMLLAGKTQRLGALLFLVCFTYVEVLDKSNYLNHYYFVSIVAFLFLLIPAKASKSMVPRIYVFSFRIIIAIVYFYAGIAKLNADWMLDAQPLRLWLPQHSSLPLIGPLFKLKGTAYLFSWMGAAFDLLAPFALFSNRLRPFFYPVLVVFHVLTWILFPIGVFPWVMIACTTVFFRDEWHINLWRRLPWAPLHIPSKNSTHFPMTFWDKNIKGLLVFFLLFQLVFPWRYLAHKGNSYWHEFGYRFAWKVMLMEKAGYTTYYIENEAGQKQVFPIENFLSPNQLKMVGAKPDLIVQAAHLIHAHWKRENNENIKVSAEVWTTLNGRRSQLMIDPFVDLATVKNDWSERNYVLPLDSVIRPKEFWKLKGPLRNANH